MLYKRLIWLKWRHLYNGAVICFKNLFYFLNFQTSKLPKRAAKNTKNMTSIPCFVHTEKFHPYAWVENWYTGPCYFFGDACFMNLDTSWHFSCWLQIWLSNGYTSTQNSSFSYAHLYAWAENAQKRWNMLDNAILINKFVYTKNSKWMWYVNI